MLGDAGQAIRACLITCNGGIHGFIVKKISQADCLRGEDAELLRCSDH